MEAFEVDEVQGLKLCGFAVFGSSYGAWTQVRLEPGCLSCHFNLWCRILIVVTSVQRAVVAIGRRFFQAGILPSQCEMTRLTKRYMIGESNHGLWCPPMARRDKSGFHRDRNHRLALMSISRTWLTCLPTSCTQTRTFAENPTW